MPAEPPSDDFIMRNAMDAQEVAVGWWPGDARYPKAAFYAYAHPAPEGFADATLLPAAARWEATLGEYILDWDDVRSLPRPARGRAGLRPFGVPARLRGVRMGPEARREHRGNTACGPVDRATFEVETVFLLRFSMTASGDDPDGRTATYGAALEMAAWSESRGALAAAVSQHHDVGNGYLPSPLPMAATLAARTTTLPITVAALLLAFYEPLKLAEDMAVIDLISRGRVGYVVGIGYRQEEFDRFGVDRRHRARLVEERIGILRGLLAGEQVRLRGRTVHVTPSPFTPGGPHLAYGGGSAAAARRAARLGMLFLAETHDDSLESEYRGEAARAGVAPVGCIFPAAGVPLTVFVSDDPDRAWNEIGEYLLGDALTYGRWNADRPNTASVSFATTVEELRAERGAYQILTPEEARAQVAGGSPLGLQPLVGGLPPEIAWRYLEAAVAALSSDNPHSTG